MKNHNKKRNVGIVYELLLNYVSNSIVEGRVKDVKKATKIIEKRFAKGTELYKEFRLFNALAKTTASDTHIVASILSEAKLAARNCNSKSLDREKSSLIKDINYKLNDKDFYYRSVSNYRDYATIQQLLNEWRKKDTQNLQRLIEFEKKVGELLLTEKKKYSIDTEKARLDASKSDKLVLKLMTEKLNKKYSSELSSDEKDIIKNYVFYYDENQEYLKEYLSNRKDSALVLLENFEDVENNKILVEKVDKVRQKIEDLNVKKINDNTVIKFLTITKLINELKRSE